MKNPLNRKAQGVLEYIVVFIVIVAVILIMGRYLRNSLSGKMREGADVFGKGEVYVPNVTGVANHTIKTETITNSM